MISVERKLKSKKVLEALTDLSTLRGSPKFIRSEMVPNFLRKDM